MDKNTILAVILSTIVVVASILTQGYFSQKNNSHAGDTQTNTNVTNTQSFNENKDLKDVSSVSSDEGVANGGEVAKLTDDINKTDDTKNGSSAVTSKKNSDADLPEKKIITVDTDLAVIKLSNEGGVVTSYKLKDHLDNGELVELMQGGAGFAVAFGGPATTADKSTFTVTDETSENTRTILFTKKYDDYIFGKRYTFLKDDYMFQLELLIKDTRGNEPQENKESKKSNKPNKSTIKDSLEYTLRTSPQIGPRFDPKNKYEVRQFLSFDGNKVKKITLSGKQYKEYSKSYQWEAIASKYFTTIVIPTCTMSSTTYTNAQMLLRREIIAEASDPALKRFDAADTYYIYCGPRAERALRRYNNATSNGFSVANQRLNLALQTSGWLGWLETILKWMLQIINTVARNWGVSIILLTVVIKLLLFPLTKKQSMGTLKMQEIQPKVQELQARYKDDPQKLQEAMAKVYKDAGYNPASGCLPLILQFLILFAMYNLFNNYFEFRGKGFIPGWIDDLTTGDSVYTFSRTIPFFGNDLRILPIIYLISQLLFGKITGNAGTAAPNSSKMQMNLMMYGMPIMFFFLFYNAPSGLLLYWTVSNIFQMVQQIIINKALKQKREEISGAKSLTKKHK